MGLFGRSRDRGEPAVDAGDVAEDQEASAPSDDATESQSPAASEVMVRTEGPWDETDDYPDVPRVDLGGLLVPQTDKIRIQVKVDPANGSVSQLSFLVDGSAVQVQPYSAPRTAGMWSDIRGQIRSSINSSGGLVEEVDGPYGTELRAQVAGQDGKAQPARFCGVDGPRWFVRLLFLGKAARDQSAAEVLDDVIRGMVVVRGDEAMPMGNAIPLRVPPNEHGIGESPEGQEEAVVTTPERPTIKLPARGPEITETR